MRGVLFFVHSFVSSLLLSNETRVCRWIGRTRALPWVSIRGWSHEGHLSRNARQRSPSLLFVWPCSSSSSICCRRVQHRDTRTNEREDRKSTLGPLRNRYVRAFAQHLSTLSPVRRNLYTGKSRIQRRRRYTGSIKTTLPRYIVHSTSRRTFVSSPLLPPTDPSHC